MVVRVYTDAAFKDGVSTHHWRVLNEHGRRLKRRTFLGYEGDPFEAELQTISSAIQWLSRKGHKEIIIHTDCAECVGELNNNTNRNDIKYLQHQMKVMNINVVWKSRETNQIRKADGYCKELRNTVLKRKQFATA